MGKGEIFTIELVIEAFKKIHIESALLEANANLECLETSPSGVPLIPREADVELDSFCGALDALMKMFSVLGRAFGFVSADVHDKTGILRKLREKANDDGTDPFRGLKPLVMSDVENGTTRANKSGARTLLRLAWANEFIGDMLKEIRSSGPEESLHTNASDAYNRTLYNHHPWIVRKTVAAALYTLPCRAKFLASVHLDEESKNEPFDELIALSDPILGLLDFYEEHDLLGII
eukprot:TRINITY_DN6210_c0_g1_i1.p1 TRINITY_DN6210_c0_g1~~TRINITY_DN6210_c0_g1_i1.p1  ORF type:complete len:234 (-),score=48.54 TRINITY_DN6210_c0_g1_i1:56-757(-)